MKVTPSDGDPEDSMSDQQLIASASEACLRLLADRLTIRLADFAVDEPVRSDGRIADPYGRGIADGVDLCITMLRDAADGVAADMQSKP
jgi:hypothetical protein